MSKPEATQVDHIRRQGDIAIGGRLRRLSERIDREAARVYADAGVAFEQRWLGVLEHLIIHGPQSVGDLAQRLNISHVSVSQTRQSLEKAGIIFQTQDPDDGRRRTLALTEAGQALVVQLTPIWDALSAVSAELNAEAGNLVATLDRLDDALDRASLYERTKARL